jgi:transposase
MNLQTPEQTFDLIVGIDRSDATLAVCTLQPSTGKASEETISSSPEALHEWWTQLRDCFPNARVAVAFEQPAPNLIAFFATKIGITLYGLNPSATWAHRQSLVVSRARTDQTDARDIAYFIDRHHPKLTPSRIAPGHLRRLQAFCEARRGFVDQRTALTNRLQALLKRYYPQAILMLHEHIWRAMNLDFLRRWSTPQALMRARKGALETFFHSHGSRSQKRLQERLAVVENLVPLTDDPDIIEPARLEMNLILDQIEVLNRAVQEYDLAIQQLCFQHAEYTFFQNLPGAGPALAPRLFAAFAQHASHCEDASSFAALCGMAPITDQSGKSRRVFRRMRCDSFLRQTLYEWGGESWKHCDWAKAFVRHHQRRNKHFNTIIRALALKWIRILWKCWQDGVAYDDAKYMQTLRSRGCEYLSAAD